MSTNPRRSPIFFQTVSLCAAVLILVSSSSKQKQDTESPTNAEVDHYKNPRTPLAISEQDIQNCIEKHPRVADINAILAASDKTVTNAEMVAELAKNGKFAFHWTKERVKNAALVVQGIWQKPTLQMEIYHTNSLGGQFVVRVEDGMMQGGSYKPYGEYLPGNNVELACNPGEKETSGTSAAQPSTNAKCSLNSDCPEGQHCKDGDCKRDCRVDRDCTGGTRCDVQNGMCVSGNSSAKDNEQKPDTSRSADTHVY